MNPLCNARRRAWAWTAFFGCAVSLAVAAKAGTTSAIGATDPGHSYELVWSSKTQPDLFTHWAQQPPAGAPQQPDDRGRNEAYDSILWDAPSVSASSRAGNGLWDDLPLNGYKKGLPEVTTNVVEAGYIVEFVGRRKGAVPVYAKPPAAPPASLGTPTVVSGVPLPSAALLFPASLGIAVYAARRMRHSPRH